ncbi:tetratricopeptide repeat protein [Hyphobacterium marinum]|uniref:Tetratricopeptide repeat protein n=1 Tax=Hyphobacterium marinum TaxID=3116574 RepID=A0ABU7LXK5_9PROT|nr:tetratricopeptide repeat protein [Hyphobacterium sp. Y6023]MEE2565930.1 tetratricopeptide repeat protein [Hyphobacterium sp. Y6023]
MRTALATLIVSLLAATPVDADVRDIRFQESGEGGLVAISFSQAPRSVTVTPDARGAAILFEGVQADGFTLDPVANPLLAQVALTRLEHGVVLRLDAAGAAWSDVVARASGDGAIVRITLRGTGSTPSLPESRIRTVAEMAPTPEGNAASENTETQNAHDEVSADAVMPEAPAEAGPVDPPLNVTDTNPESRVETGPVVGGTPSPISTLAPAGCALTAAAVEADGWDLDALTAHSACLADEGRGEEARPLLERVLAFEPSRFDAALMLAEITEDSGERSAAQALFEQAAEAARTDGQAAAARARARALAAQTDN